MNPHDELKSLLDLFPGGSVLIDHAEHVASGMTPEPYRTLLAHCEHMTERMEAFHKSAVDVRVLSRQITGNSYSRKILLLKQGTESVVQFGIVRFDLGSVSEKVREEILSEQTPLGRILIRHNVFRSIELGAILRITAGPGLADALRMPVGAVTYGRLATIFCDGRPAVDLLEVSAMLSDDDSACGSQN